MTSPADAPSTLMAAEIAEAPAALARFFDAESSNLQRIGARLRELSPAYAVTCARGSSDNTAGYFKYLSEILAGVPVASVGPSVASIYKAPLRFKGAVVVSVSQSGKSPDIVALQARAREAGAFAVAIVNDASSPLAAEADAVLPLHAGPEKSVAATKTCLSSAAVLAALVAEWHQDKALQQGVRDLPAAFEAALTADWDAALPVFEKAQSAYVIGRGPAFPIAQEAALKLKETAVLHAEAYSGAEVMHGPLQLVDAGFPVLAFRPRDAAFTAMGEAIERMRGAGANVFVAGGNSLPFKSSGHALLDPLAMLVSFYGLAEKVARGRGHDPDRPSRLRKVTETI
ncbi:glucosamine--fructose-6-phosphate aminotransferase [Labrys miyagiensis]|uniref:Glucosamine--fructose-6-phosphate aminotransferase n=1 Tax=Labrys miyagiensis TaxID=346912 RepID=A0ABQ6CR13_9HYPH|nr:SIS domain-containing protein [Labrys miyagiensis]GLS22768.1 glucosamine--fructose-6-phosphate aminotransferase [Labrys miyagiensis]